MVRIGHGSRFRRTLLWLAIAAAFAGCTFPFQRPGLAGLTCLGVPDDTCVSYAQSLGLGTDPTVIAVQLECTRASCSGSAGEVRVLVRRADGRVEESGFGWQDAAPEPVPPVPEPVPVPAPSAGAP
jgi:hypothetical protein